MLFNVRRQLTRSGYLGKYTEDNFLGLLQDAGSASMIRLREAQVKKDGIKPRIEYEAGVITTRHVTVGDSRL
jgi:hypothetical protein